jgi:hypothetical protein
MLNFGSHGDQSRKLAGKMIKKILERYRHWICKHDFKMIMDKFFPSPWEELLPLKIDWKINMIHDSMFKIRYVCIFKCDKCGKIKSIGSDYVI